MQVLVSSFPTKAMPPPAYAKSGFFIRAQIHRGFEIENNSEELVIVPRMPKPMKPFHLYDMIPYRKAKVFGTDDEPIPFTTYGKTVKDAMKTFVDNHVGSFVLVSDGVEKDVVINPDRTWIEPSFSRG